MPPRGDIVSVGYIATLLADRAGELAQTLLPGGTREGNEWVCGSLGGERGRSCSVKIKGDKAGVWSDFSTGEAGDALDLVARTRFNGHKGDAVAWAKSWLGLDGQDPGRLRQTQAATQARSLEKDQTAEQLRDTARRMWCGSRHKITGTLADDYLRTRGIDLSVLGKQPGRLAYLRDCWNKETGLRLPAMLAAIQLQGQVVGVHRTWLEATGPGAARKAVLHNPKMTLGPWLGGCIPLWAGGGVSWKDLWVEDARPCELTITEGIENALSVAIADPKRRVAACVSIAGMRGLVLPDCVRVVTIAADNDAAGSPAAGALLRVVDALAAGGREIRVARAPAPHKDFNDWLQALRRPEPCAGVAHG